MTATSGFVVPANAVKAGSNFLSHQLVADGVLSPTNACKFDTSDELVICTAVNDENCIGIAGLNHQAIVDGEDPMTHAFADGELVPVHMDGFLHVVADTLAMTRGLLQVCGATTVGFVENTGAVTWEPTIVGRAMRDAATTVHNVIKFF